MSNRDSLIHQLRTYQQRQNERFARWQASGFRHDLKPAHEPVPEELQGRRCVSRQAKSMQMLTFHWPLARRLAKAAKPPIEAI